MAAPQRDSLLKRLAWFAGIWLTSVAALAVIAMILRWLLQR